MKRFLPLLACFVLSACELSALSDQGDSSVDAQDATTSTTDSGTIADSSIKDSSIESSIKDSSIADTKSEQPEIDAPFDQAAETSDSGADNSTWHSDASPDPLDGTPERLVCTDNFGTGLTKKFGRLDGFLTSIVLPGEHSCNGDDNHVHLQVKVANQFYDIAVNVSDSSSSSSPVQYKALALNPKVSPWAEGWHDSSFPFDYVSDLQLHSDQFAGMAKPELVLQLQMELEVANHISVYATGYGQTGGHLIHRNHTGEDGAIVVNPLGVAPRVLVFHFENQSF